MKNKKEKFISDIIKVYKKHDMSISHEDHQGSFIIENNNVKNDIKWLRSARLSKDIYTF